MNKNSRKPSDTDNTPANENQNIEDIQEELKDQSEFLHTIFASIKHPFCVIDVKDYTVKYANPAALRGGIPEGLKCYSLIHKNTEPCSGDVPCPLKIVVETGYIPIKTANPFTWKFTAIPYSMVMETSSR